MISGPSVVSQHSGQKSKAKSCLQSLDSKPRLSPGFHIWPLSSLPGAGTHRHGLQEWVAGPGFSRRRNVCLLIVPLTWSFSLPYAVQEKKWKRKCSLGIDHKGRAQSMPWAWQWWNLVGRDAVKDLTQTLPLMDSHPKVPCACLILWTGLSPACLG